MLNLFLRQIKLLWLSLLFIYFFSGKAMTQTTVPSIDLTTFKWGLVDSATTAVITPAKYDYVTDFRSGLAFYKQDGAYGIIDENGKEITPAIYENYHWLNDSLLKLKKEGLYGVLTLEMEEVMPFVFPSLVAFEQYLVVNNGEESAVIDFEGDIMIPFEYDEIYTEYNTLDGFHLNPELIRVSVGGKMGVINYQNKVIIPLNQELISFLPGNAILALSEGEFTLFDRNGEVILPSGKYQSLDYAGDGIIAVKKGGKYGYINLKEKVLIPFVYDKALAFNGEFAPVMNNGNWGVINLKNKIVIPLNYQSIRLCKNDMVILEKVVKGQPKYAVTRIGKSIEANFMFDEVLPLKDENVVKVKKEGKWGVLDAYGKEIVPVIYDALDFKHDYIKVVKAHKHGLYDLKGKAILPSEYSFIYPPKNDIYIMVRIGARYGYTNHSGEIVIPLIYENARSFANGRAAVLREGESFFIDRNGERIE